MNRKTKILSLSLVFIGFFCVLLVVAARYRPSIRDFENATVVEGIFTYDTNGRLYHSAIDGRTLYRSTSAFGTGTGFSSSLGIPWGAHVQVSLVKLDTLFGNKLLGVAISAANKTYYRQTPEACLASWDAGSRIYLFLAGAILLVIFVFILRSIK